MPKRTVLKQASAESCLMQAALTKISRLEDIDEQLRSQLEKMIGQRNQLSAEKAARDIEVKSLQQ